MVAELAGGDYSSVTERDGSSRREETHTAAADSDAVQRLAAGDIEALGELYDRHQSSVRRLARRMGAAASDADDVVHATFLAARDNAASFEPERSCRAWLLGIAANLTQQQHRKHARWRRLLGAFRPQESAGGADPERAVAAREGLGRVEQALLGLAEPKRIVVIMAELEGLSGQEIADALAIPVGTVWTRLHHARRELSAALAGGSKP
jgi:RNA polymerase sigma-70 factor (ECF subfamily)